MTSTQQTTLRASVSLEGIGVHSGRPAKLTLHPSEVNSGISFLRTGSSDGKEHFIEANYRSVSATELCTVIGEGSEKGVSTIEHVMAALRALNIDNVVVEIDGFEVPIMDGSAADFVAAIDSVGVVRQNEMRRYIKILKPIRIAQGRGYAELLPQAEGFTLDVEIDFDHSWIGRQRKVVLLNEATFRNEICRARTFGFVKEVEYLWKAGFALGSSLDNSVALSDEGILNPEGLRYNDEFVAHKMLDAIGDLALSGLSMIGMYRSYCGGHKVNFSVLRELFSNSSNYMVIEERPARREVFAIDGHVASAPVFAPEKR